MKNKLPRLPMLIVVLALVAAAVVISGIGQPTTQPATANAVASTDGMPASDLPAQPPQAIVPRVAPTIGDQLITQAATRLERRASVSARMRHQLLFDGNQLYGIGSYWQQGSGEDLRVRLELQIAGQDANLLQVSDSRFLWLERRLPTGRNVTRVDLRQLRADPSLTPANLDSPQPGSASWSSAESGLIAHTGGLPSLLSSLGENFEFLPPQAMRLAAQTPDPQAASIPVFAVVGHWRQEKLAALLLTVDESPSVIPTYSEESTLTPQKLPARLPQEVLLLVGQADLFPYRIEYRRLETPTANPDGPPIPYQLSTNPMVVLELIDVAFDVPIETGQFDYAPGDAEWTDQTATVLERLRQQRDQVATHATGAATSRK